MKIKRNFHRWLRYQRRNLARFILGFDDCPIDNRKSFKGEILYGASMLAISFMTIMFFAFFLLLSQVGRFFMKIIVKDGAIYSVGSWDSEKNQWVCQNVRTEENRLFDSNEIMKAIDISPALVTTLKLGY